MVWTFALAFAVRFYLSRVTAVVNPDGLIYLHQAKAIYFHQWGEINACGMKYLSILPPMIALAFSVFRDWVVAGRFVSLVFSCGMFIPLYFILKRFFELRITILALLIYALIPALAGRSAEIIRGPIFWFFLTTAFLMVLRHQEKRSARHLDPNLYLACIFFLVAAWARIEAILYLVVTAGYLLYSAKGRRVASLTGFLSPLFLLALIGLSAVIVLDLPLVRLLRLDKPISILTRFATDYSALRTTIDQMANTQKGDIAEFLKQAGDFVWVVPFGPLLDCLVEKFFYPYVLIFLCGFAGLRRRMKGDPRIVYFVWLCTSATLLLYFYTLKTWLIYDRFLVNLILPAVLIVGFGCENSVQWLTARWHIPPKGATIILAVIILIFGLGKNVKPRYAEKAIFPQIGKAIAQSKTPGELARIAAGPSNAHNWVFFYANQDVNGVYCNKAEQVAIPDTYRNFIASLKKENVRFVLWSKKTWPQGGVDLMAEPWEADFEMLGKWNYDRKEDYLLLRLKAQ